MQFAALKPGRRKGILLLWPQERRNFAVQGTTLAQTFGVSIALLAIELQYNLMTHRPIFCGLRVTTQRERKATVMWVLFAFGSALFAGLTSVLAKCGIKSPPSVLR